MEDHKSKPQQPTVCRVVQYTPGVGDSELAGHDEPGAVFAALVVCAHPDDGTVNLAVFDHEGRRFGRGHVAFAGDVPAGGPEAAGRWSWPART